MRSRCWLAVICIKKALKAARRIEVPFQERTMTPHRAMFAGLLGFILPALVAASDVLAPASDSFTPAVAISKGGEGWEAAAGVDAAGESVAVWIERTTRGFLKDHIWTKSHSDG